VEHLEFSPLERKIYDSIFTDAKKDFEQLAAKGLVSRNYTHILAMLMRYVSLPIRCQYLVFDVTPLDRLRRAVLHPNLVLSSDNSVLRSSDGTVDIDALIKQFSGNEDGPCGKNVFAEGILTNLGEDNHVECPICLDVMQQPMIIPACMHQWYVVSPSGTYPLTRLRCSCKDCIVAYLATCDERYEERRCPTCQQGPIKVWFYPSYPLCRSCDFAGGRASRSDET